MNASLHTIESPTAVDPITEQVVYLPVLHGHYRLLRTQTRAYLLLGKIGPSNALPDLVIDISCMSRLLQRDLLRALRHCGQAMLPVRCPLHNGSSISPIAPLRLALEYRIFAVNFLTKDLSPISQHQLDGG